MEKQLVIFELAEEHFGIEINADTIANLTSIDAIRDHIKQSTPRN